MNLKPIKICSVCKDPFKQIYSTTQKVCSHKCAIILSRIPKKTKEDKERKKIMVENITTIPQLIKKLEFEFNRFIRFRDLGQDCISCDKKLKDIRDYHAGHYYSAGHHSNIRFNELNVNGQCIECNTYLHGNLIKYRPKLENKIGNENLHYLDEIAYLTKKWNRDELIKLFKIYKLKNKINECSKK
ncbi:Bacteriophage lambda NinG [uncultured Caudovirales phage]|uniref:Protein ninG n=1 Tax=uncultured Caudovirales phage TaxID=2100421 RepID=A0A6J5N0B7_9CAUD|nr:Bacteriophage lambda NinG [uncultured Caudovirales phage]